MKPRSQFNSTFLSVMSKAQQLPFEVLSSILQVTSPIDRRQCSLTCTSWNAAARPFIFKSLRLRTDQSIDQLKNFPTHKGRLQPLQGFVKIVKIVSVEKLNKEFSMELLHSAFPYIEEIKFGDHESSYLRPLNSGEGRYNKRQTILLEKIYSVIAEGGFPNLKKIPLFNYDETYWNLVAARKTTIEWLHINENSQNKKLVNSSLKNLDLFPRLKTLLAFMESNKSLERLFPGGLTEVNSIAVAFKSPFRPVFNSPLLDVKPLHVVKELNIRSQCLYVDGDNFFLYIMQKFPDLENLVLSGSSYGIYPRLRTKSLSAEVLIKFFLYLTSMKYSHMSFDASQSGTANLLITFLKLAPQQQLHFDERIVFHLDFTFNAFSIGSLQNNCDLSYSQHTKICKIQMNCVISDEDANALLPFLRMTKIVKQANIVSLTINPEEVEEEESNAFESLSIPVDKFLFYSTNLKSFVIKSAPTISLSKFPPGFVSNVQDLNFVDCSMHRKFFQAIDLHFPQLKKLKLDGCSYPGCYDPLNTININMPSISLDELFFSIPYDDFTQFYCSKVFIKLSTEISEPRYCRLRRKKHRHHGDASFLAIDDSKAHYTEKDYKAAIRGDCMVYTIHCKAVTEFIVESQDGRNHRKNVFI